MGRGAEAENAYWILDTVEMKQPGIQLVFESELATDESVRLADRTGPFAGPAACSHFFPRSCISHRSLKRNGTARR